MKRTFGDWKPYGAVVLCPRGYVVAAISEPGWRGYHVPELGGAHWGEVMANRDLIAAAPELLVACGAAVDYMTQGGAFDPDRDPVLPRLQAAIAKAKGEG